MPYFKALCVNNEFVPISDCVETLCSSSSVMWKFFSKPFWRNHTCKSVRIFLSLRIASPQEEVKMPVGCLGGSSSNTGTNGNHNNHEFYHYSQESEPKMDIIVTSSVLNAADQFAFMQQTLLMQIFRLGNPNGNSANGGINGSNAVSGFNNCPTCIAFSDRCCQDDSGKGLFEEFIEANLHYCVWDQASSDALNSLR